MTSLACLKVVGLAVLVSVRWAYLTVAEAVRGSVWLLLTEAVFWKEPAVTSAVVMAWLPVQETAWVGLRVPVAPGQVQLSVPRVASVTATPVRVAWPLLVATMV